MRKRNIFDDVSGIIDETRLVDIDDIIDEYDIEDDDDDILNESVFGNVKMRRPSKYGLRNSIDAADQFVGARDGRRTSIDMAFHNAFPHGDGSGFDAFNGVEEEYDDDAPIDFNTTPTHHSEEDQFTSDDDFDDIEISTSDLVDDDDDVDVDDDLM